MYCAGFVDTFSSHERVAESFRLFKEVELYNVTGDKWIREDWPAAYTQWITEHIRYLRRMTTNPADEYWERTRLILAQVDGLLDGFNAKATGADRMTEVDMWLLQAQGDLADIPWSLYSKEPTGLPLKDPEFTLHCTAMVSLMPDYSDLFFAHDTWSDVRELHAVLKEYNLNIPEFKAKRVTISTRTGHLSSIDDFYTNDAGLLVFETTLHNFNETATALIKPESVLTWLRAYHAMFATDNGKDWTDHFIKYNSGTYNNEYVVVDMNKFTPGKKPETNSGLVWMIEQLPGAYHAEEQTERLITNGFIQSINTPYFEEMFNYAMYPEQQKKDPKKASFWSFDNQMRNKVILNLAPKVNSYDYFKWMMRYNNLSDPIQHIPESGEPEPSQGILARYDLRPPEGTVWGARNYFAGLDTKAVSVVAITKEGKWDAINSPKYDEGIPVFNFSDWGPGLHHHGLPDQFKFDWTEFGYRDQCLIYGSDDGKPNAEKCKNIAGCGFCLYTQECYSGDSTGPAPGMNHECPSGWSVKTELPAYALPLIISVCIIIVLFLGAVYTLHYLHVEKHYWTK